MEFLSAVFLISALLILAWIAAAVVWSNRKQKTLRREMKRHLQALGTLDPYDPTRS